MASWTDQDVAYLRKNPHLWRRFETKFGSLPEGFEKPTARDVDIQYLKSNPSMAPKFEATFGYLPEGFEAPQQEPQIAPQAAPAGEEVIQPPDQDVDLQRAIEQAPDAWNRTRSPLVFQGGRRSPGLIDVPEESLSPELQKQRLVEGPERYEGPTAEEPATGIDATPLGRTWNLITGESSDDEEDAYTGATSDVPAAGIPGSRFGALPRALRGVANAAGGETLDEGEEEAGWWETMKGYVGTLPEMFQSTLAGYEASKGAKRKLNALEWIDTLNYMAEREGKPLIGSSAVQAIAAERGLTEADVIEELYADAQAGAASEEEALQLHADLRSRIMEETPKTREGSMKYYAGAVVQAIGFMGPSVATGLITRNPNMALALMGTQVYGDIYGEQRNSGRSHEQASMDAAFGTSFELLAERVPLGVILGEGGGRFLKRVLKAGALEGMEEIITESLNIGYEIGVLKEDMTFGEAMVRLKDAGIIGAGAGVGLTTATTIVTHPFIRDSAPEDKLPPQLRELVGAHQELSALVQKAADPTQKVSREQLDAAKARYERARKAGEEAKENPDYAKAINEAANEVARLEAAKKPDAAKLKEAQDKLTALIRGGPEAMVQMQKEAEEAAAATETEPESPPPAETAAPEAAPAVDGRTGWALDLLTKAGAHAVLPESGTAKEMIKAGLVRETTTEGLMLLPAGRRALADWKEKRHENVINVGLDIGGKADALSPEKVKEELAKIGVEVVAEERQRSKTENTMVASLSRRLTKEELGALSVALDQEAIAGRFGDVGELEGPNAADWGGEFLPQEFREPKAPKPAAAAKPAAKAKAAPKKPAKKVTLDDLPDPDVEPQAPAPNPILEPEKVTSVARRIEPTAEDISALEAEYADPAAFNLRTNQLKAELSVAELENPAARVAIEAAIDARQKVAAEQEALSRAEQENEAYAKREAAKAKEEARKQREMDEMVKQAKEAGADDAIALAEFLNKQELEESSPSALAAALKDAYSSLEKREKEAIERLKSRRPVQGQLFDLGGAIVEGSKVYKDLVEVGALKIAKGLVRFADWSAEMTSQFGKKVIPHLQKLYEAAKKEAGHATKISHRKFKGGGRAGEIVAAPPGAKTTQKLQRLRGTVLKQLATEGAPGRFWYERSGQALLDNFGGDKAQARLFAGLLSIYSAGTALAPNTTAALKAWNQFQAGLPVKAGTGANNKKAEQWLRTGIEPRGLKVSNFYNNLMREIDPENYGMSQGATIDLWMMRAFGYERDVPTDAQYVFALTETKKLAKALGWEPQQAQAAIWVAIKARWDLIREAGRREAVRQGLAKLVPEGKQGAMILKPVGEKKEAAANERKITALFRKMALRVAQEEAAKSIEMTKADYMDEMAKHVATVSWSFAPTSDIGKTILKATLEEQIELLAEIDTIMINPETGREYLAEWMGLIGNESFTGIGAWENYTSASKQSVFLAPPGKPEDGAAPDVEPGARKLLSAYSSIVGYMLRLSNVSWHRPTLAATMTNSNGVEVDLGRQLDTEETDRLYRAVYTKMRDAFGLSHEQALSYAPVPTPYGFRVMNFYEQKYVGAKAVPNYMRKKSDTDFHDVVTAAVEEVFPLDDMRIEYFRAMGEMVRNDWAVSPNGESYASRISTVENQKVQEAFDRAKRELAPRIEAARSRIERRILARERKGKRPIDTPVSMGRILTGGAQAVDEIFARFGDMAGRETRDEQKIYDLSVLIENPDLVQAVADAYGYKIEYFSFESNPEKGVEFRLPTLKKKGYKDGYVWIYDPRNEHGSFKGSVEYTRAWRVSHEIAHGITEQFMQAKYGDSRRYGILGRDMPAVRGAEGKQVTTLEPALTLKEAQRAVEWEDVAFRAQRIILEQMGVKISDKQFAHENNINIADAVHRVVTGDFADPGGVGFLPADKPADVRAVLKLLEEVESEMARIHVREPTVGVQFEKDEDLPIYQNIWEPVSDSDIKDAVARARKDGMGQDLGGIDADLQAPRVFMAQSGLALPRKPANAVRFRNFRPAESTNSAGVKKLRVKTEAMKMAGNIAMADEYVVDVPAKQLYNVSKDKDGLRKAAANQAGFEAAIEAAGYAGFYQTGKDGRPVGTVSLFESTLASGMQESINRFALENATPPRTKPPKVSVDNPGGNWLQGKIERAKEDGVDKNGVPKTFGTVTGSLRGNYVLMPIDKAAAIPGMRAEQKNVRKESLEYLTRTMAETGRLPEMRAGEEYVPYVQVDSDGNAWVNEGNHRIMAAKELGWTHIPVEVRWFNGGEAVKGPFSPESLLAGHAEMAKKPRLPKSATKHTRILKRWAKRTPSGDKGAALVLIPAETGTIQIATVRPARMLSVADLNEALAMIDELNMRATLAPASLGFKTVEGLAKSREMSTLREAGFRFDYENNQMVREPASAPMFSVRRRTNHGKGIPKKEADAIAERMRATFPYTWSEADIYAVESWEDLPADLRQSVPDGFSKKGEVEAVFYDPGPLERPQLILIANNAGSRTEATTALIHEIVGHYGVRGVLGAGYQNYMDSVWDNFEKEAREAAKRNGLKDIDSKDPGKRRDARNKAAEEFIAYLAGEIVSGNKPPPAQIGFWESIVRAVKRMLIRYGLANANARDIAALINSAKGYARGNLFAKREAHRREVMLQKRVPEFYSQLIKYVEEKFPNSATPAQYLEQIRAAQKNGHVKKEELETVGIENALEDQNLPSLKEVPSPLWHKDVIADLRRKGKQSGNQEYLDALEWWIENEMGHEAIAATKEQREHVAANRKGFEALGRVLSGTAPSKITKDHLLSIINDLAPMVSWELVQGRRGPRFRERPFVSADGKQLYRRKSPLWKRMGLKSNPGAKALELIKYRFATEGGGPLYTVAEDIPPHLMPFKSEGASIASGIAEVVAQEVDRTFSNLVDASKDNLDSVRRAKESLLKDGIGPMLRSASEMPADSAIPQEYHELYDAILEKFVGVVDSSLSIVRADRMYSVEQKYGVDIGSTLKDYRNGRPVSKEGMLALEAYSNLIINAMFSFGAIAHADSIVYRMAQDGSAALPGLNGMSAMEYMTRTASIGGTKIEMTWPPVEVVKVEGNNLPVWPIFGRLSYNVEARNTETGETTSSHNAAGPLRSFAEELDALHDWGSPVDPRSRDAVSNKWSSYTLSEGLNAYQEWLLVDDNPGSRPYRAGHWSKKNAAHLRSGFILDESTGKLAPIALEIQSDTGQEWQKEVKEKGSRVKVIRDRAQRVSAVGMALVNLEEKIAEHGRGNKDPIYLPSGLAGVSEAGMNEFIERVRAGDDQPEFNLSDADKKLIVPFARIVHSTVRSIDSFRRFVRELDSLSPKFAEEIRNSISDQISDLRVAMNDIIDDPDAPFDLEFGDPKTTDDIAADFVSKARGGKVPTLPFLLLNNLIEIRYSAAHSLSYLIESEADIDSPDVKKVVSLINNEIDTNIADMSGFLSSVIGTVASRSPPEGLGPSEMLYIRDRMEQISLKTAESSLAYQRFLDALEKKNEVWVAPPSHASTTSHQLAAIKKLVAQAVENDMDYVFFAPGEHSAVVAAMGTSVVNPDEAASTYVRSPFDSLYDMMSFFLVNPEAAHGGRPEDQVGVEAWDTLDYNSKMAWAELWRGIDYIIEDKIGYGAFSGIDVTSPEAIREEIDSNPDKDIKESIGSEEGLLNKALPIRKGYYAAIFRPGYSGRDNNGLTGIYPASFHGLFPVTPQGKIENESEVIGQIGYDGLRNLKTSMEETPEEGNFLRVWDKQEYSEFRVNWTNPNTSFGQNFYGSGFETARGLRYAYNTILPNVLKKFAKQHKAKLSLREAGPVTSDFYNGMENQDPAEINAALRSWRHDGMPVQPSDRSGDYSMPKLMALEITDSMREAVRTTGFPMFSVKKEVRAAVMGDEITGTGLKFRDFFSDVTRGVRQQPTNVKNYSPAIKTTDSTKAFASIRQKYSGNFEDHIMTSIPGYREAQDAIFVAMTNTLGEAGGTVLDIGASEGAALKAITQVNPKIKGVALDPNPAMRDTFNKKGGTKNVDYALAAFGTAKDAGKEAWTEDDGTKIKFFDPKGQTFDFIYEGMVFQFISNERKAQLGRAKEMLAPDGVLVIQEKFGGPKAQYDANEAQKDDYKAQYYTQDQLEAKKQEVLQTGGDAVEGMTDLQVSTGEIEAVLGGLFKNVVQIWDSGNFKGYAASDSPQKLAAFTQNLQPLDSEYSNVETPAIVQSEQVNGEDVMFSIKTGQTGNSLFDSFASKVGPFGPKKTLGDIWRSFKARLKDRAIAATLDIFHGQKIAEEALGLTADEMGYVSMRLAAGSDSVVRAALEFGVPIWKEGATSIDESAGGFLDILLPLAGDADKLRAWELWMIARRASRLKKEGREKLFEDEEIREVELEVAKRGWTSEFEEIAAKYGDWKKRLLDFAEEAGIINPDTRPMWEHSDHIPFYRVLEGDLTGPFSGGAIADVKQQIVRLRGSDKAINDPMQNILMNIAALIDASMRNHAARLSVKNLDGSGLVTKHPQFQITQAAIPLDQLRARLRNAGVNPATMDAAGLRGIESLTAIEAPTGANVVSFMDKGKRYYYEVHDPLVLVALKGVHPNPWTKLMSLLRGPKRLFTQSITLDPIFMVRNWFRDMFQAFILGRDGALPIVPGYDSVRGAISSLTKDKKMIDIMSGGGSFDSGYVNANDPAGMAKIIRGRLGAHGLIRNWTTGKVVPAFEFYRDLSSSIENSHRVMVFQRGRDAGKSLKAASFEARDLMDFSMRGAHPIIRFLAETVPFWNARVQGLYRTFRVTAPGSKARKAAHLQIMGMLLRGALLTLASVALFFRNKDDERWKELNDYEKNTYYHFFDVFEPGDHYALPKPFEIGAIFSTIPEIIAEGMTRDHPDAARAAGAQFYHVVAEALNLAPDVQAVMPIAELAMNRDTFRDSPILTDYDKKLLPEDQDHYRMSPVIRDVAQAAPDFLPESLRSPKQLRHLVLGYTGTLGSYAVGMADTIWWRLNEEEAGLPPEKRPDEIPGVRSFVRNSPRKYPRELNTLYTVLEDADRVYNSMRRADKEGDDLRLENLEEKNIELVIAREVMDDARNEIREINREIREIHTDKEMGPEEKRKEIDQLLEIRNDVARDVYEWRPGGAENRRETESFKKSLEAGDFTGMTKKEQRDRLDSIGLPKTSELVGSASLSRREIGALIDGGIDG